MPNPMTPRLKVCRFDPATLQSLRGGEHDYHAIHLNADHQDDMAVVIHERYHQQFIEASIFGSVQRIVRRAELDASGAGDESADSLLGLLVELHERSYIAHEAGATYCTVHDSEAMTNAASLPRSYLDFYAMYADSINSWSLSEDRRVQVGYVVTLCALNVSCIDSIARYASSEQSSFDLARSANPNERIRRVLDFVAREGPTLAEVADERVAILADPTSPQHEALRQESWAVLRATDDDPFSGRAWGIEFRAALNAAYVDDKLGEHRAYMMEAERIGTVVESLYGHVFDLNRPVVGSDESASIEAQLLDLDGGSIVASEPPGLLKAGEGDTRRLLKRYASIQWNDTGETSLVRRRKLRHWRYHDASRRILVNGELIAGAAPGRDWLHYHFGGEGEDGLTPSVVNAVDWTAALSLALRVEVRRYAEQDDRRRVAPGDRMTPLLDGFVIGFAEYEGFETFLGSLIAGSDLDLAVQFHDKNATLFWYMGGHVGRWIVFFREMAGDAILNLDIDWDDEQPRVQRHNRSIAVPSPLMVWKIPEFPGLFVRFAHYQTIADLWRICLEDYLSRQSRDDRGLDMDSWVSLRTNGPAIEAALRSSWLSI